MGKVIEFIKKNKVSIAIISILAIGGGIAVASEERKIKRLKSENEALKADNAAKDKKIEDKRRFFKFWIDKQAEERNSQRFCLILKDVEGKDGKETNMWFRPGHNYKYRGIPVSDKQIGDLDKCISKIIKDSCNLEKDVKINI